MRILNFTGAGPEYLKSSIPFLQEPCLKMLHQHWVRMQLPLDKYIGTRLKEEIKDGNPAGGWDPHELRTIQDFYVRYSLTSAKGVAEVASIGGFVKEYQVDIDPNAMKAHGVILLRSWLL